MLTTEACRFEAWRLRHSGQLAKDPNIKREFSELAYSYDRLAAAIEGIEDGRDRE
jgi:hypothetical protein